MIEVMDGVILALVGLATTAGLVGYRIICRSRKVEEAAPTPKPPPVGGIVSAASDAVSQAAADDFAQIEDATTGELSPAQLARSKRGKR